MMNEEDVFDVNEMPDETGFEPLPKNVYEAIISNVEVKKTQSGGKGINITWDVTGPTHQGAKLFDFINTKNASAKCVEIGRGRLKTIMVAAGIDRLPAEEIDRLVNTRMKLDVVIVKGRDDAPENKIKSRSSIEGSGMPKAQPMPTEQKTTESKAVPPWLSGK